MKTAAMTSGGFIVVVDGESPEGLLPLFKGKPDVVESILMGAVDKITHVDGGTLYIINEFVGPMPQPQRYAMVMLWLAKTARLYSSTRTEFFVNKAANKTLRRQTAKAINSKLN